MCSIIMKEKGQRAARKSMTDFENKKKNVTGAKGCGQSLVALEGTE